MARLEFYFDFTVHFEFALYWVKKSLNLYLHIPNIWQQIDTRLHCVCNHHSSHRDGNKRLIAYDILVLYVMNNEIPYMLVSPQFSAGRPGGHARADNSAPGQPLWGAVAEGNNARARPPSRRSRSISGTYSALRISVSWAPGSGGCDPPSASEPVVKDKMLQG